jgi:hypothetical protein
MCSYFAQKCAHVLLKKLLAFCSEFCSTLAKNFAIFGRKNERISGTPNYSLQATAEPRPVKCGRWSALHPRSPAVCTQIHGLTLRNCSVFGARKILREAWVTGALCPVLHRSRSNKPRSSAVPVHCRSPFPFSLHRSRSNKSRSGAVPVHCRSQGRLCQVTYRSRSLPFSTPRAGRSGSRGVEGMGVMNRKHRNQ